MLCCMMLQLRLRTPFLLCQLPPVLLYQQRRQTQHIFPSTCCCLQGPSSVSHSFPSIGLYLLSYIYSQILYYFYVFVKGIVFKIYLPDSSSLVYRNVIDFGILIFHPTTLSNSLMNSCSFLIASFRIFYVRYHVIWKQ